jgi:hypothetical protein
MVRNGRAPLGDKQTLDAPASSPPPAAAQLPRDWFVAAIEASGTVGDCLGAVIDELSYRRDFITAVRLALTGPSPRGVDAVTDLSQRIRALENTLRFRLGILRPERPAAWFRAPAAVSSGPFAATMISEPVFNRYDPAATEQVRAALTECWRRETLDGLPFTDRESCLWRTLLGFNQELARIVQLPEPFAALRLDRLPDGLPAALDSRALRAFLLNVRGEAQATKERLTACYNELAAASERFWAMQERDAPSFGRGDSARGNRLGGFEGLNTGVGDMRAEFRRRRAETQRQTQEKGGKILSPRDLEALRFMSFEDYPAPEALRQRYLNMAKTLHPDRAGGDDHSFKELTRAYTHLSDKLEAKRL